MPWATHFTRVTSSNTKRTVSESTCHMPHASHWTLNGLSHRVLVTALCGWNCLFLLWLLRLVQTRKVKHSPLGPRWPGTIRALFVVVCFHFCVVVAVELTYSQVDQS